MQLQENESFYIELKVNFNICINNLLNYFLNSFKLISFYFYFFQH